MGRSAGVSRRRAAGAAAGGGAQRSGSIRRRSAGGSPRSRRRWARGCSTARPQGYALTEAGRSLLEHAAGDGERRRRGGGGGGRRSPTRLSGTVRIGAPDGVSNYLLIDACDALSRDNPGLQVQVVALPRMFSLSKREADLAITVSPPTAGRLTVRKIADYRLRLYGRADLVDGARRGPLDGRSRGRARDRLHLGHDLRQGARLLRAARAVDRAVADVEFADHAAALDACAAAGSASCPSSSRASIPSWSTCCPTTSG